MEGAVLGVIIKNAFQGQVSDWLLNICVAIATGAPFFSNLSSFFWVRLSLGRSKARLVSDLAILFCVCTFAIAFVSFSEVGLVFFISILIVARILWSGILTVRSNIWRANYPRHIRGKVTAKLATLAALIMSVAGISVGWILDWQFDYFRWIFISFSVLSLIGAYSYRSLAVRHQAKEISREKDVKNNMSFTKMFSLLKENKSFAKYMLAMFILGSGNLMFMAPLIVYLNEYTGLQQLEQILITTAIPLALIPVAVRWWAKLLDGNHIFHFRSIHSWVFVCALAIFSLAQLTAIEELYFVGSIIYGIAFAGGVIGWNLGHNDFVGKGNIKDKAPENPMDYMAIHVTLTGIRGLITPIIGIALYQWLESRSIGLGQYALILPLAMTTLGAVLFTVFNKQNREVHS